MCDRKFTFQPRLPQFLVLFVDRGSALGQALIYFFYFMATLIYILASGNLKVTCDGE